MATSKAKVCKEFIKLLNKRRSPFKTLKERRLFINDFMRSNSAASANVCKNFIKNNLTKTHRPFWANHAENDDLILARKKFKINCQNAKPGPQKDGRKSRSLSQQTEEEKLTIKLKKNKTPVIAQAAVAEDLNEAGDEDLELTIYEEVADETPIGNQEIVVKGLPIEQMMKQENIEENIQELNIEPIIAGREEVNQMQIVENVVIRRAKQNENRDQVSEEIGQNRMESIPNGIIDQLQHEVSQLTNEVAQLRNDNQRQYDLLIATNNTLNQLMDLMKEQRPQSREFENILNQFNGESISARRFGRIKQEQTASMSPATIPPRRSLLQANIKMEALSPGRIVVFRRKQIQSEVAISEKQSQETAAE